MSINHFSTDLQETSWWQQRQREMETTTQNAGSSSKQQQTIPPNQQQFWPSSHHHHQQLYHQHQLWVGSYNSSHPTLSFNLNQEDNNANTDEHELDDQTVTASRELQETDLEKEPMFEKPLTPSDVGKLNRLVIPKQHAEKYFPLGGDSGDKGLLLSFEDESGKCWRFRYSYWNSSQSYVLTKGWSRYVKEKRLDAGDIILFERHRTDSDRLFIGWRRRGTTAQDGQNRGGGGGSGGGVGGWSRGLYSGHPYPVDVVQSHGVTVPYQPDCLHAGILFTL